MSLRDLLPPWPRLRGGFVGDARPTRPAEARAPTTSPGDLLAIDGRAVSLIRALVAQAERQRELAHAQTRFLANASHQLKAPLTVLRAQVDQALMQTEIGAMRQVVARLHDTTDATGRLLGQLLALARAEPGRRLAVTDSDLSGLAREAAFGLLPLARARRIDLGFEGEDAVNVRGEPDLLREVVVNLVHNALSYTPEGGVVTVSVWVRDARARLRVLDNGCGIPPGERERVLERFYRLPGAPTQGSGLGLAIVREICERHGIGLVLRGAPGGGPGLCVDLRWPAPVGRYEEVNTA